MNNTTAHHIEALLFATAEPYTVQALAKRLDVSPENIREALGVLEASLEGHALMLVKSGDEVTLATRAEHGALIETIRKEELSKELSKASAETLAIIAYYPGVSKAQIEFIRGVNTSYSLRALSMRGLVESRGAGRAIGYYPTLALLEHFGVSQVEALPHYTETVQKITQLLTQEQETH
jgi:segregation and condensation protein B